MFRFRSLPFDAPGRAADPSGLDARRFSQDGVGTVLWQAEPLTVAGSGSVSRRVSARGAVAVAIISFIALLVTMPRDLDVFDEGIIFSGAMRVLAGEVIHRDFYSLYGPAQYYIVAGILKLSDHGFFFARLYDLIVRVGILTTMFFILGQQCTNAVALAFTFIAGVWMVAIGKYLFPIFPCILLSLIASYLTVRVSTGKATFSRMMGVGALSGMTALFRYESGAFLLLANILATLAIAVLFEAPERRLRQCVLRMVAFGAGALVVFAPAAIAFLLVAPIGAFTADLIDYPLKYYAKTRGLPFPGFRAIGTEAVVYLPFLGAALAGGEFVRQLVRWPSPGSSEPVRPELPYLLILGAAASLMLLKGLVPFPGFGAISTEAVVYLPFLGAALAGVEFVRQLVLRPSPGSSEPVRPELPYLLSFGATASLMLLKGLVRVSPIHMMMAILPALVVLAVLVDLWERRGRAIARIAAVTVFVAAVLPTFDAARDFVILNLHGIDHSVAGWLLETSGLVQNSSNGTACDTIPTSGFARLPPDDARVATYLAVNTQPGERILVALDRTDKIVVNAVSIYYAAGRLPGTHWSEFDPGLQTRADIQTAIISDLQRFGVRWVVRDKTFDGINEPNESAHSSGVHLLDDYIDQHYRKVAIAGQIEIWLANGVTAPAPSTRACDATPVP